MLWEAQFGDFVNVAQVIIDQFLASAEDKWGRFTGLVLLLPHGYEGMGPEHSSARIERFLTLAAEDNLQVVQPTTPAQMFHVLRRQVMRSLRKPLVVLTPKSLLRHPECTSSVEEFQGQFQRLLAGRDNPAPEATKLVLLCSGKVYYELLRERRERGRDDVALWRLEQLYPVAEAEFERALQGIAKRIPVRWVQEEPANMGAAVHLRVRFGEKLDGHRFDQVTRPASASPATGSHASHAIEQRDLFEAAFRRGKV